MTPPSLPPRRTPATALGVVPVPDDVDSQQLADRLAELLNTPPDLAGAAWTTSRDEVPYGTHLSDLLAWTAEPRLPPGWLWRYALIMAWHPGNPETDWTPTSDALLADLANPLHQAWPCPAAPPKIGPFNASGFMIGNRNAAFAGAAPPPGYQPY